MPESKKVKKVPTDEALAPAQPAVPAPIDRPLDSWSSPNFKSGYISIVGIPNAGKSSLVNALVRETVTIVTAKPQTTRKRTLGVLTIPNEYQMVFVDTPGIIESEAGLNRFLKEEVAEALKGVDCIVGAISPWEFEGTQKPWALQKLANVENAIFIITQADKLMKDPMKLKAALEKWDAWTLEGGPKPILLTSSRNGMGLKELLDMFLARLPLGPQYYDTDIFTPQTMREITAEIIRKHCFEMLHQEVPYGLAILLRKFEEGPIIKIEADILLSKESHKGMVIGQGGSVLKMIGSRARFELEKLFGQKIYLKLHVVVKPQWLKDKSFLEELGYVRH